jgi:gliding motility-associated-like protein
LNGSININVDGGVDPKINTSILLCDNQNVTINELSVKANLINGGKLNWYSTTPIEVGSNLAPSFVIPKNPKVQSYYATLVPASGCETNVPTEVVVSFVATFNSSTQLDDNLITICKENLGKKKIGDINTAPYSKSSIAWFSDNLLKNQLNSSELLEAGKIYATEIVQVSNDLTCYNSAFESIEIEVNEVKFTTLVIPNKCDQSNGEIKVTNLEGNSPFNFEWKMLPDNSILAVSQNLTSLKEGAYSLKVTDSKGCEKSESPILIKCQGFIPQIITPDNNGQNDYFVIKYSENYPRVQLSIYNRWGSLVYQSSIPYLDDWDGKPSKDVMSIGTETLPTGTYYYVIDKGNGDPVEYGYLELVK